LIEKKTQNNKEHFILSPDQFASITEGINQCIVDEGHLIFITLNVVCKYFIFFTFGVDIAPTQLPAEVDYSTKPQSQFSLRSGFQ